MQHLKILLLVLFLLILGMNSIWAQVVMLEPKNNTVSEISRISVTVAGKAGDLVNLEINDEYVLTDTIRIDGLLDYLNIDVPIGPVKIRVWMATKKGRIFAAERNIHVLGPAQKIIPLDDQLSLPADGVSEKSIKLEIQDAWAYRIKNIRVASASIEAGEILNDDLDPATSGVQVAVKDGYINLLIKAASGTAGLSNIDIQVMGFKGVVPFNYDLPMIPFILVGGLDVAAATQGNDQDPLDIPDFGILNNNSVGLGSSAIAGGRAAFYTTGSLKPGLNLTASFDTDRGYMDQMFYDVDVYEQYPLMGDASTIVYDAQTRSKLYTKLQYGKTFALLGDYNTNFSNTEFAAYNRTFNGLKSDIYYGLHKLSVFGTLSDRTMLQEEIRGEGISGYYRMENGDLTRFSEKVELITRDRYHSEKILKRTPLGRFQDYDVNYVDGTLMFKQPIPSIDAEGNPIFIIVSYEYETKNADRLLIGGARYEGEILPGIKVGSTIIVEEQALDNYGLIGVDFHAPIGEKVKLAGEIASSSAPDLAGVIESGLAYRIDLEAQATPELALEAYYREIDSGFVNGSQIGGSLESNSRKVGISGKYKTVQLGQITSEFYNQELGARAGVANTNQVFNINLDRAINKNGKFKAGYEFASRDQLFTLTDSTTHNKSHLLRANYRFKVLEKVHAVLEHQQNLASKDRSKPTSSSVGLTYPISDALEVFWKYSFIQGTSVNRQSVLGFNSLIGEETELEAKYEISGITGEQRNRATIALHNRWEFREYLILNTAIENVSTLDSLELPSPTHQAMALSMEFLPDLPLKGIAKLEVRDDPSSVQRVFTLGGDMKISDGFGALAKFDHHERRYKAVNQGSDTRENYQFGLVYRPHAHDVINVLGKMAYVSDRSSHATPSYRQDRLIFSSHTYWQIKPMLGLGGRIAARMVFDEEGDLFSDRTNTFFASLRGEYSWDVEWSTILDIRSIYLSPLGESAFGLAAEVDYLVMQNMQVGLGYIFKNFSDPDFDFLEYQYNNIYVSLHMKFSEDIFNWR